uniref:Uncharacterized protein n=1 Tax=Anguilla anguilla TaxID=7936 RepID=A0A0E9QM68_ANGAN
MLATSQLASLYQHPFATLACKLLSYSCWLLRIKDPIPIGSYASYIGCTFSELKGTCMQT